MSLTWTQAANQGKWWMSRPTGDVNTYNRHVQQIMNAHGVSRDQAQIAHGKLSDMLQRGQYGHRPTAFGFASTPRTDAQGFMETHIPDDHDMKDYEGPTRWGHLDTQKVDLSRGVHSTQQEMDPHVVAHNLFHPGKLMPTEKHNIGNPDFNPDEEDAASRAHADGVEVNSDRSRFYQPQGASGPTYAADGHHRIAADLLLGKKHADGLVWDDTRPPAKTCDHPGCASCREAERFRKELDIPWPSDPSKHRVYDAAG